MQYLSQRLPNIFYQLNRYTRNQWNRIKNLYQEQKEQLLDNRNVRYIELKLKRRAMLYPFYFLVGVYFSIRSTVRMQSMFAKNEKIEVLGEHVSLRANIVKDLSLDTPHFGIIFIYYSNVL